MADLHPTNGKRALRGLGGGQSEDTSLLLKFINTQTYYDVLISTNRACV